MSERVMMRAHILFFRLILRQRYLNRSFIILDIFVKYLNSSTKQAKQIYFLSGCCFLWTSFRRRTPLLSRVRIHFNSLFIQFFFLNIIREFLQTYYSLSILRCRRLLIKQNSSLSIHQCGLSWVMIWRSRHWFFHHEIILRLHQLTFIESIFGLSFFFPKYEAGRVSLL